MIEGMTAGSPRVSAIITTFNYAPFIAEALESVLSQSRVPDEIVVVDDGSTDGTREIVASYADRGVRYVYQENAGAGASRNRGLLETSGELVAFLDADDTWLPGKTDRQAEYLASNPDAVLVSGHRIWWDVARSSRRMEVIPELDPSTMRRELCIHNVVGNPSMVLVRRAALDGVGAFDEDLRWGQDWDMFIRLASVGRVGVVPEPVIIYRWHKGGLSHERRWERLSVIHQISRSAIDGFRPAWRRPLLRARSWSEIEFDRSRIMMKRGASRRVQLWHAVRALLAYPPSRGMEKAKLVARIIVGERAYQSIRTRTSGEGTFQE